MRMLKFCQADISRGHLVLVNASHPVRSDLPANRLVPVRRNFAQILLEKQTAKRLAEITARLGCEQEIVPVSGYRTMHEQQEMYVESLRKQGFEFTQKFVALPGCSEHQTGLAIDLAKNHEPIDNICPSFPEDGICGRFRALCIQFGFIVRYPAGCERITGIAHEPWHFRYVGYPHAEIIREQAGTLENYTETLKQFHSQGEPFRWKGHQRDYEMYFVPVPENQDVFVEIPDGISLEVSGNNDDGVVVTLGRPRGQA